MRNPLRTALAALAFASLTATAVDAAPAAKRPASRPAAKTALAAPGPISETTNQLADWVRTSADNNGLPFVIIDKAAAQVFVFGKDGKLIGAAPALLGFARGDNSTPGIGDREMSDIAPEERTTPAGRFLAAYGPAIGGEKVFWVDYETAISLHPVVTSNPKERRLERLRSATIDDNRITFGCINVAKSFYEQVVRKTFAGTRGIVYILPEKQPIAEVFPAFYLATLGDFPGQSPPQSKSSATAAIRASSRSLPW